MLSINILNSIFVNSVIYDNAAAIYIENIGSNLIFNAVNLSFNNIYTNMLMGACIYINNDKISKYNKTVIL